MEKTFYQETKQHLTPITDSGYNKNSFSSDAGRFCSIFYK